MIVAIISLFYLVSRPSNGALEDNLPRYMSEETYNMTPPPASPDPNPLPDQNPHKYKSVTTTVFWVGEGADESNDFIPNDKSFWDSSWMEHYGGIDDPEDRCGYRPCSFVPKENPFYFALPYGDREEEGDQKSSVKLIPWFGRSQKESILKNVWIEIKYKDKTCYAQWQDVGPFETDDFEYVFGDAPPKNTFGVAAGLDISPAAWDCLGLRTNAAVQWRFVDEGKVPDGPWKEVVTTRDVSF